LSRTSSSSRLTASVADERITINNEQQSTFVGAKSSGQLKEQPNSTTNNYEYILLLEEKTNENSMYF
jgi:hypothetical protein